MTSKVFLEKTLYTLREHDFFKTSLSTLFSILTHFSCYCHTCVWIDTQADKR